MENKICAKPMYKCGICSEIYETVQERMNCEMSCVKKQEEAEKKAAAERKLAEKKMRKEAVDEAMANAFRLARAYMYDYGTYEYDEEAIQDLLIPSRIWHYFG